MGELLLRRQEGIQTFRDESFLIIKVAESGMKLGDRRTRIDIWGRGGGGIFVVLRVRVWLLLVVVVAAVGG